MNNPMFSLSAMCLVILLLIFLFKRLRQPYITAYILAGVLIGPFVGKVFVDTHVTESLGEIGIVLLMFFLGMEIDIPDRRSLLIMPITAQGIKIALAIGLSAIVGIVFHWPPHNILLLSIMLIFNSTAIVSEYLSINGEIHTAFGKAILNILLLQDVLLTPVLSIFQFIGHGEISFIRVLSSIGICVFIGLLLRAVRHNSAKFLPALLKTLEDDHELQVFMGGFLCLGFAVIAEATGLSGAIGSFTAGLIIGRTNGFHWLERSLKPFQVFFVAFFFMSIGLRLDLWFITYNFKLIVFGTLILLLSNSLLSALVIRLLRNNWNNSLYGGALLSQPGEFGIMACSLAYEMRIIDHNFFKTGIAITALSLLFSTTWMTAILRLLKRSAHRQNLQTIGFYEKPNL